ncbi:EAL domain-containing protein [Kaistia dalseonensis]|uniref:Diguanylate cyclase (GGDEF)-like protein n=1 Tax=Kaistia dalseonensis TaxID=410840 RepID=A0ABU0H745_9HYPH|nr:EAL domain-containing protein [Kaistia dalseonensis]MCX5495513.1 EAL domain-containing protein [Kaistia dalseonensis]MDQ0438105.1 diguanylate cyclase (GGDEF)-like protein [Kaistia dalseonensis]
MLWRHIKLIVAAATLLILIVSIALPAIMIEHGRIATISIAESSLERSAQAVEDALNRQLLQVHGALASVPSIFAAAGASPDSRQISDQLLQGLNFQTLAYRDLLLVRADGTILATARYRRPHQPLAIDLSELSTNPTALIGPTRNTVTGEWSLYVARSIPEWHGVIAVAEVPLLTLMGLLAETRMPPGATLRLERRNGQLIAALPHDEVRTGRIDSSALGLRSADGQAFISTATGGTERLAVVRASLYSDVRVVLAQDLNSVLADWRAERGRGIVGLTIRAILIAAFAAALVFAIRQRERAEAERARSTAVLEGAIETMSDGFAMWDTQDRLVTSNQRYRDLYTRIAPLMVPGCGYEELLRRGVALGQYPQSESDPAGFIERTLDWHRRADGPQELLVPDEHWLLMQDRRMANGGIVSIRTDITPLKATEAKLAEANRRANAATEEAKRQNEALSEREGRIRFLAHHDELTRLPNRALFHEQISETLHLSRAHGAPMALLYLDLDRFKEVNDTLGHQVGDALLRTVAERLGTCVRDTQTVARLGGDEFAVISPAPMSRGDAESLSARIISALSEPYDVLGHTIGSGVSIGIALGDGSVTDPNTLLQQADLALYEAKAKGRSTTCVFAPEMEARLRDRLQIESDLRVALAEQQFALAYQPIFNLETDRLCGFEALLRWRHPERGLISPAAFIPIAEETRLIVEIGAWVLRQACRDIASLPGELKIAANLSPVQLAVGDIATTLADIVRETGLDPSRIELEITETALFADDQRNLDALRRLKALGVRIVLDDFGTGYSSLSHLRLFPLDKIKIDRSFVQDMVDRPDSAAIVEAVTSLARRLGMTTTAEGIETAEQLAVVRRIGCTEAQGYLLGRPEPIAAALETVRCSARVEIGA